MKVDRRHVLISFHPIFIGMIYPDPALQVLHNKGCRAQAQDNLTIFIYTEWRKDKGDGGNDLVNPRNNCGAFKRFHTPLPTLFVLSQDAMPTGSRPVASRLPLGVGSYKR